MMLRLLTVLILAMSCVLAHAAGKADTNYFIPQMSVGEHFSNAFSIAVAINAEGFDAVVRRNGGTADYTLMRVGANQAFTFETLDLYDGSAADRAENIIRDGGATSCWNGDCRNYTDASGLLYNRLLWGSPHKRLKVGMSWEVAIDQAWELGPAGTQLVTVMQLNDKSSTVTLKREGTATGAFANESAQVTLVKNGSRVTFDVTPGEAHWNGYTTFKKGIVQSDELLVVRHDTLHSETAGTIKAATRRYMLLNTAPYPTLS
jgi:hypothetical protein